jgi:hypothetical protein
MEELEGLRVISENYTRKKGVIEFVILEQEKDRAIDTLTSLVDTGSTITLYDNRDKREGSISIKKENEIYLQSGGGHGFSVDWRAVDIKDVSWLIKVTAPFNYGESEYGNATIKKNS